MIQTYPLEKWWRRQPPVGSRVGVLARTSRGVVKSVRLRREAKDCVAWAGAIIRLAVYDGRAWPHPWRVRIQALQRST